MLADVPQNPSALVQAVGRSIRMYGHNGLPVEDWTVDTSLYVAVLPRWLRSPLGAWAYRSQRHGQDPANSQVKARKLLRRLLKVGVTTLDVLKERLDAHLMKTASSSTSRQLREQRSTASVGESVADSKVGQASISIATRALRPTMSDASASKSTNSFICANRDTRRAATEGCGQTVVWSCWRSS